MYFTVRIRDRLFFSVSGADFLMRFPGPVLMKIYVFVDFFPVFFLAILFFFPPGFSYLTHLRNPGLFVGAHLTQRPRLLGELDLEADDLPWPPWAVKCKCWIKKCFGTNTLIISIKKYCSLRAKEAGRGKKEWNWEAKSKNDLVTHKTTLWNVILSRFMHLVY